MGVMQCKKCNQEYDTEGMCPNCGYKLKNKKILPVLIPILLILFIGLGIVLFSVIQDNDDSKKEKEEEKSVTLSKKEKEKYQSMEDTISEFARMYVKSNATLSHEELIVSINDLIDSGYLSEEDVLDVKDKKVCDGYAVVNQKDEVESKAYIRCSNYETKGYSKKSNDKIENENIAIPDVSGYTLKEAKEILERAGFKINDKVEEISDDDFQEGQIVKTSPTIGTKREKGTEVTLYMCKKSNQYVVEDFVAKKMHYLTAQGKLEAYGINVRIQTKEVPEDAKYEDGQVIEQSVAPGEKLGTKDSIILYIPNVEAKYPDFTNGSYTIEEVQKFCDRYNVTLEREYVTKEGAEPGKIVEQSKPQGYTVVVGTTLKIKIAQ